MLLTSCLQQRAPRPQAHFLFPHYEKEPGNEAKGTLYMRLSYLSLRSLTLAQLPSPSHLTILQATGSWARRPVLPHDNIGALKSHKKI